MWLLELSLICAVAYVAWRQHRLESKVDALHQIYNELADLFDERK